MKPKNDPVGTCECPLKGCDATSQVYKYRAASDDPARRRHANKLYCICPKHGRIESNEFLLEKIKWLTGPRSEGGAAPVKTPEKPAPQPVSPPAPKRATPSAPPEPAPATSSSWLPEFFK